MWNDDKSRMTFSSLCLSVSISLPAELQTICKEFHKRVSILEADKYDLEWKNKMKNLEVNTARLYTKRFFSVQSISFPYDHKINTSSLILTLIDHR